MVTNRQRKRPYPVGHGQCALGMALVSLFGGSGCTHRHEAADAGIGLSSDAREDAARGVAADMNPRIGLSGGLPCDASAQCLSGACTVGVCSDWANAMRIVIDTTPSGADVDIDVVDFPLLVRLSKQNFPFDGARQDGADIRFVDAQGRNLAYQIERWDAKNAVAELWVLVPHIAGNSPSNFILMYWGNPLVPPASSGPSVFGDYALVFHMAEDPDSSPTQIQDDSGHENAGHVQKPPKTNLRSEGIAGDGLDLDGVGTYLTTSVRNPAPKSVSISLWLKTNGPSEGGIVGFASTQAGDQQVLYDRAIEMDSQGRLSFSILRDGTPAAVSSLASYGDGEWHFVVARLSSAGQYLFVDGEDVADDPAATNADPYYGLWRFGEEPDLSPPSPAPDAPANTGNFIFGSLDEARITSAEASDAWIKLSFATQRPDATAVVYLAQ